MNDLEWKYFDLLFNLIVDLQMQLGLFESIVKDDEVSKNLLESMARFLYAFKYLTKVAIEEASNFLPEDLPKAQE